ncbi:MAG: DsrE family protein [Myxococcota bacterium]
MSGRVCIFLHRGEYDAVHQGLSIAAAATAVGREVELYFFWWALERLVKDKLDEPDLERDDVNATMELRGVPTLRQLLHVVRDSGLAKIYACSGSMAAIGLTPPEVEPKVDSLIGWTTILQRTAGVVDRFTV